MSPSSTVAFFPAMFTWTLIYLVTPALGVTIFLNLRASLMQQRLDTNWQVLLFALFFAYGGILEILLTVAFWEWSGMASIGVFLLLILTLPAAIAAAALLIRYARLSHSQRMLTWSTAAFPVCMFLLITVVKLLDEQP